MKSMTGFGKGGAAGGMWRAVCEISSVNRKQLDVSASLPREIASLETKVSALIRTRLSRGAVKCSVSLSPEGNPESLLDRKGAAMQIAAIRSLASGLNLKDDLAASALLELPKSVLAVDADSIDCGAVWKVLEKSLSAALDDLVAMRVREGAALESDLRRHLSVLKDLASGLKEKAPLVSVEYKDKLVARLKEFQGLGIAPDDPSLLREVALFADRCDISEELARLDSHFAQTEELLCSEEPSGRPLDFLCQEMNREINTVGSKSNNAAISSAVIRFKAELEAFREQVQNVE